MKLGRDPPAVDQRGASVTQLEFLQEGRTFAKEDRTVGVPSMERLPADVPGAATARVFDLDIPVTVGLEVGEGRLVPFSAAPLPDELASA